MHLPSTADRTFADSKTLFTRKSTTKVTLIKTFQLWGFKFAKNEGSFLSSKESDNASLTSKISLLHNGHFQFKTSMGDQDLSLFKLMNKQCSSNVMENIFFFFYQFLWIVLCRILYRSSLPLPINAGMPQLI